MLVTIPDGPNYGDLLLDPAWDSLRAEPAFAQLLEEARRPIDPIPNIENASAPPAQTIPDKSIAVLPFENLSDDKANSFFADGVQDEILTDLAKLKELKVISRTSVMQYKNGTARNLREIAQQLGVAHVLEGSVQRAGNRIRISAQLIDRWHRRASFGPNTTSATWPMCSRFKTKSRRASRSSCRPKSRLMRRAQSNNGRRLI